MKYKDILVTLILNITIINSEKLKITHFHSTFVFSPFHKTLPKSILQMHWISVRFMKWAIVKRTIVLTKTIA